MLQLNSLNSYPVFPNWVFTGTMQLDNSQISELISDISKIQNIKTHYGFHTKPNKITQNMYALSQLLGKTFFENAVSHFRLAPDLRHIESVDPQMLSIAPGQMVPPVVNRHRWYQAAVFLSPSAPGSDIYLDMLDSKLYSTPPGVQDYRHVIESEQCKLAFWPAHLPWGITPNQAKTNSIIYTSTFIIKRG